MNSPTEILKTSVRS